MSWRRLLAKAGWLVRGGKETRDLEEEIRIHLALEEQERRDAGMTEEEARYSARRTFGNATRAQEESREIWIWRSLENFLQDGRYAFRQMRRNLGFTTVAVLTFALGIGATTAVFSVINAVLLRPLPFKDPGQLVDLKETEVAPGEYPLSGADYLDWQRENRTFAGSSLYGYPQRMNAGGNGEAESVVVSAVQANLFDVLGVRAFQGRTFRSQDGAAAKNGVAVLSYGFWQRRYGGTSDVVGKKIILNNETATIVGVMQRGFHFRSDTDVWIPLEMTLANLGPRGNHGFAGVARVKSNFTLAAARADLLGISKRLEKQNPDSNNHVYAVLNPLKEKISGDSEPALQILMGAVCLVLLVASANVANLQLARANTRHREMAVRSSLGAGRYRLLRQIFTESLLLALMGALVGLAAAWWGVHLLQSAKSLPIPRENPIEIDSTVLLFTTAVSVAAGIFFGFGPMLRNSERSLNTELRAGVQSVLGVRRARQLARDGLVVTEIAITLALLVGAGLLLRSFVNLRQTNIGVNPNHVWTASVVLPEKQYQNLPARVQFFERLLTRMRTIPGIEDTSVSSDIPLEGVMNGTIAVDGNADPKLSNQLVGETFIQPSYFHTYGIRLLRGRAFTEDDVRRADENAQRLKSIYASAAGRDVQIPADLYFDAVISDMMARTFWRNQNPIGRTFRWNGFTARVIGVVNDVREDGIRTRILPLNYFPMGVWFAYSGNGWLTVKAKDSALGLSASVQQELRRLDPNLALSKPRTMDDVIAEDTDDVSLQAWLLGTFAGLTLVLAAVGLYGVMSYLVTQRTREIGVRMALGAERANVLSLILKRGVVLTGLGMAIGVGVAFGLTRFLRSQLYGVEATDPMTFAVVVGVLAVVSAAAYWVPAHRAMRVDPVVALREE